MHVLTNLEVSRRLLPRVGKSSIEGGFAMSEIVILDPQALYSRENEGLRYLGKGGGSKQVGTNYQRACPFRHVPKKRRWQGQKGRRE